MGIFKKKKQQYKYVTDKTQTWQCIGLVGGKYDGVVYRYGKVGIEENGDSAVLRFNYEIVDSNGIPVEVIGDDFKNIIGDILTEIIEEQTEYVDGPNGKFAMNNSEEE